MKVCCALSLESPRGDSNEYTQHTSITIIKKIALNYSKYNTVCSYWNFSKGLKNEFEIAVVNEASVFQPMKFYCILISTKGQFALNFVPCVTCKSQFCLTDSSALCVGLCKYPNTVLTISGKITLIFSLSPAFLIRAKT